MVIAAIVMAASVSAHVRPLSEHARVTLADGRTRSPTVARLLAALDESDVIVFVDTRVDPAIPTAETSLMTTSAGARYVSVIVNPRLSPDQRIEYLGHELQHAVEIAEDDCVVDGPSIRRRFAEIGREVPGAGPHAVAFETDQARQISLDVRRELAAWARARRVSDARGPR